MPALNKLSSLLVKNAQPGKYSDGGGLWLHEKDGDGGKWFLGVHVHGRRREMGLGTLSAVSLKEARVGAEKWRAVARQGKDPIKERERIRRERPHHREFLDPALRSRVQCLYVAAILV